MGTKFTKGKWEVTSSGNAIIAEFPIQICLMEKSNPQSLHNALLISKAPEMFEMLVKVRQAILSEDYTRMLCESQSIKELLKEATEL